MKVRIRPALAIFFLLPAIILASNLNVDAAKAPTGSASGLSISPLRQDITLKPGQADKIDITLKNITGGPITAQVAVRDFQSDNISGNPKIITDPNYKSPNSIRGFLVGLANVPLATGQQKSFNIPVQTPSNASPGAYYGLITYQAVPADGGTTSGNNKVALSAAVSQLVFITVPGNVSEHMQLNAIHIYRDTAGTGEGIFFTKPPKELGIELHNYGNGFATPFGNVTVKKGSQQVYSYELNGGITRGLLLPNSSRIFKNALKNVKSPGRYTVTVNASYGSGSAILTGKKTFWYVPAWLLILVLVVIVLLIVAVWLVRRRYKRSGQRRYQR